MALSSTKKLYLRLLLKFFRITGFSKYFRVQDGSLKGYLFNVNVDNDIFYGTYEHNAVEKIRSFAKQNEASVFYDIGAHYGFYSLVFSKLDPKVVIAFEPFPANFNILQTTLRLNSIENVQPNKLAIANNNQPTVLFTDTGLSESNTFVNSAMLPANTAKKMVAAKSIDELVENHPPPSFIKIDVEGAEYEVLQGALETIKKYRPHILLATHDCHLPGVKGSCLSLLHRWGYATERLDDKKAMPGLDDFLCIPA